MASSQLIELELVQDEDTNYRTRLKGGRNRGRGELIADARIKVNRSKRTTQILIISHCFGDIQFERLNTLACKYAKTRFPRYRIEAWKGATDESRRN